MVSSKSLGIVFLDRHRVSFYTSGLPAVATWEVPTTLVGDLGVVENREFESQLKAFMHEQKFDVDKLLVVLSEAVYFTQSITGKTTDEQEKEAASFVGSVPCDVLLSKTYRVGNQRIIVATCGELVDVFTESLTRAGCSVVAVIPQLLLGVHATKRWMDQEMATWILSHVSTFIPWSMTAPPASAYQEGSGKVSTPGIRLPHFLAILVALLLVLVIILMRQF